MEPEKSGDGFEKYVYQVGQLTKEANESGVFPGKAFVVAAFDPKKKEFGQVYRLNVNCENEKVFTETGIEETTFGGSSLSVSLLK